MPVKSILLSSSIKSINVKLPSGDLMKVPLLVDTVDLKNYAKRLRQVEKGLDLKLHVTSKA